MKYFHKKVVIVTGAGSGIGKAICQILGQSSTTTIIAIDVDDEACLETIKGIARDKSRAFKCDVADYSDFARVIEEVVTQFSRIDILFNNAGIGIAGEIKNLTMDDWYRVIDVNIKGVIHGSHLVYSKMLKQNSGHIVNIACLAGLVPFPDVTAYTMSKHAIVGFSSAFSFEAAQYGIRVTMVCPSAVDTKIVDNSKYYGMSEEFVHQMWRKIPKMKPDRFAMIMLRKIAQGKKNIVIPFSTRVLWSLYRLCPVLVTKCFAVGAIWAKKKERKNENGCE
ncbi:SDR family NAD(P)-dependent oxidoreductase [Candidatus Uabimicrobium sp. HlEnr_7]|uniref:SDR family NAD(P)-dependent oxidoreductase n=1 Tax=Candidatus Uabimicrobium helgolandensis TaxID=3095367 RepID=UPI0035581254